MSEVIVCDRCDRRAEGKYAPAVRVWINYTETLRAPESQFDLCSHCADDLAMWVERQDG